MSEVKDIKMISLPILTTNTLLSIKNNIEIIINKDEEIIEKYLERIIYTSSLSINVKDKLDKIFKISRESILDNI